MNVESPEAERTTYRAHGGGIARMLLTSHFMKSMEFFAWAVVPPGNIMEEHVDVVEEIKRLHSRRRRLSAMSSRIMTRIVGSVKARLLSPPSRKFSLQCVSKRVHCKD